MKDLIKEEKPVILELKNVKKSFGETGVLNGISLSVREGDFVTLLGSSGCGKTTTLRIIAGLESPDEGEVLLDGVQMGNMAPEKRNVNTVFQNYALFPHMSVYDNMAFGLKLRKTPKEEIDKLVQEAARILDLSHLLDRKPKALSGGQRQRVAMGRAIVRNPKVFLMDEPLSNLDAKLRGQMRIEISKLHQRLNATIIYVTHDQTEAMTLGTRIVVMKDGVIQQVDSPQNLYDKPCNKFVAGFIGAPQMNLIDAVVGKSGSEVTLTFDGHTIALPAEKGKVLEEKGYNGKTVTLGIRPEDLHDDEAYLAASPKSVIDATIRVYEMLGAEVYLYFDVNEANCTARVNPRTSARPGDTVKLALDLSKIHVFDKDTEQVIVN